MSELPDSTHRAVVQEALRLMRAINEGII